MEPIAKRSKTEDDGESSFAQALAAMEDTVAQERRPPAPHINPLTDTVVFQQIELDHYVDRHREGMDGECHFGHANKSRGH